VTRTAALDVAASLVGCASARTQAILARIDANGDGTASWAAEGGGLAQAAQHMQFLKDGEGMA
jgi:hypothetical protein